jgi:hypothetical protein
MGNVNFGEFVLAPVNKGTHSIYCAKEIQNPNQIAALVQSVAQALQNNSLEFRVGENDVYVMVQDPATIFHGMKLSVEERLPDKFHDQYLLSKECTACLPSESISSLPLSRRIDSPRKRQ